MTILGWLIPISLLMGGVGLVAFVYAVRSGQYEDLEGDGQRMLSDDWDEHPKP